MTGNSKYFRHICSITGVYALLLLVVFVTELAVLELFAPVFSRLGQVTASLLDAVILVLLYAVPLWYLVVKPLFGGNSVDRTGSRFSSLVMFFIALTVIFLIDFLVMLYVPAFLPGTDDKTRNLVSACANILFCFLPLWCLFKQELRNRRTLLADSLGTPLKLYFFLLAMVFLFDLLESQLIPYNFPDGGLYSHKIFDAFLITLFTAPFLWMLMVRPLKRIALFEKTRSDALQAQVIDAIMVIDERGVIESFNPAAEAIFGFSADEMIGKSASLLLCDNLQCLNEMLDQADACKSRVVPQISHEVFGCRRDGTKFTMDVSVSRILLDGRRTFLMIMRDISVRKKMERALRNSEERFRSLSESAPIGVYYADPEGYCLYTNQRWRDITGLTFAEALGDGWAQAIHPEDREAVFNDWNRSVEEGQGFFGEFRFLNPDGEIRWVQAHSAAVRCQDGSVIGYVGTDEDITKRKLGELNLHKYLSLLTTTLESTADGILVMDSQRNVQTFNQKFLDMWGLSRESVEGADSSRLMTFIRDQLQDPVSFASRLDEIYCQPEAIFTTIIRFKDGRVFERYSQPQMAEGKIIGRVFSYRDITSRTRAEDALRESETRFRDIFEQTEDAIIFFKPGSCSIIDVNSAAESLYGYRKAELQAGGLELICTPENFAVLSRCICNIRHGETLSLDNIGNLREDGTDIFVSLRGKLMTLQNVDIVYCSFRDVTKRILLEEEAREMQAKLIQTNKMASLGLLVSGVAHEINNPNNFIQANAQLLSRSWEDILKILREYYRENGDFIVGGIHFEELDANSPQLFAGIIDGSQRINEIISNLKSLARQERLMAEQDVDINQVVTSAVSILHHEIIKYTENFKVDLARDIPHFKGSRQQLGQVIINLLMNACQALPARRCGIFLSTGFDAATDMLIITIIDEGCGISHSVGNKIMEPFFTTKLDDGGTGLGLSISQSIIKDHNGFLEFESEPGEGTTFIVKIPMLKASEKEQMNWSN